MTTLADHFPEVVKRRDGDWGVICHGCSAEAQDYTYPCKVRPDSFPPPVLSERASRLDAWFGAWECGCTDTERTPLGIPEYCPQHGRKLISNFAGATKVQLNHSGVSGYGIKPGPALGNPRSNG